MKSTWLDKSVEWAVVSAIAGLLTVMIYDRTVPPIVHHVRENVNPAAKASENKISFEAGYAACKANKVK